MAGSAYSCIRLPSLVLGKCIETFGEVTSMTGQLIRGTPNTQSTFRQFGIDLVKKQPVSVLIELLLGKF